MKNVLLIMLICIIPSIGLAVEYQENWATDNNYWIFYDGTGDGDNIPHSSTGGQGSSDTGYVYCDFSDSPAWIGGYYWPAQLLDAQNYPSGAGGDLTNHYGGVYTNNLNSADLNGANLNFFVCEWEQITQDYVVYMLNTPIAIGQGDWLGTTFQITDVEADWTKFDGGLNKSLGNILQSPQQYGFGFLEGTGAPTGVLGLDTFSVSTVPEPSAMMLSFFGLTWFIRKKMRK